jgi:CRISPR-associated protein Cmr4
LKDRAREKFPSKRAEKGEEKILSEEVAKAFGKQDGAGDLIVSDARLLLLPVRSLTGQYKWATCPYLLERLDRDINRSGLAGKLKAPIMNKKPEMGTVQTEGTGKIFLEEREFEIKGKADGSIIESISQLMSNKASAERLAGQLIVLNDDDFKWFASYGLPICARNVLDEDKKTSLNLWYEETLPMDCLFYTLFLERGNGAIDLVKTLVNDRPYLQVGGNETVGQGWFALSLVGE